MVTKVIGRLSKIEKKRKRKKIKPYIFVSDLALDSPKPLTIFISSSLELLPPHPRSAPACYVQSSYKFSASSFSDL